VSRRIWFCLAVAAVSVLCLACSAQAALVTLGSPLTTQLTPTAFGSSAQGTFANTFLSEPGSKIYSPFNGTLVQWRITGATGGPFTLRILRSVGGNSYTAVASSESQVPDGKGTKTFATEMPIQRGDLIALDSNSPLDQIGTSTTSGGVVQAWVPALADGATGPPNELFVNRELGFNADLRPVSHRVTLGKVKRNKTKGTATIIATVPDPGGLVLFGKGLKRFVTTAAAPGKVKLKVRAKGNVKRALNATGRARVKARVKFSPSGISPGKAAKELTLRKTG
jgi:hypothetical protein